MFIIVLTTLIAVQLIVFDRLCMQLHSRSVSGAVEGRNLSLCEQLTQLYELFLRVRVVCFRLLSRPAPYY